MAYDNTPTVNVTCILVYRVIKREGLSDHHKFLGVVAVKRTDNDGWALPGGYQECPEQVRDAAKREVLEETGINLNRVYLHSIETTPDGRNNLVFWTATITEEIWFTAKEAFVPNEEVSDIELKTQKWDTPFPLHTKAVSNIFAWED